MNPFTPSSNPDALNIPMTPEQEESIIREAMEFQFPSQSQKQRKFLKLSFIGALMTISFLVLLYFFRPQKQIDQEFGALLQNPENGLNYVLNPSIFADESYRDSPYFMVLKNLAAKRYRFVILKETETAGKGKLATGYYESSNFNDFVEQFQEGQDQVGYVYVGPKGFDQLYLVVYSPDNKEPQKVLKKVNAPSDIELLAELGLQNCKMLVAKSKEDIKEAQIVADSQVILAAIGSEYSGLFQNLANQKIRWLTLKHPDPNSLTKVKVTKGVDDSFEEIADTFEEGSEQVTIAWIENGDDEQLVMIVYAPGKNYKTQTKQVLEGFRLPGTTKALENLGLPSASIYVATKISNITAKDALRNGKDNALIV